MRIPRSRKILTPKTWHLDCNLRIHTEIDKVDRDLAHRLCLYIASWCSEWHHTSIRPQHQTRIGCQTWSLPGSNSCRMPRIQPTLITAVRGSKAKPWNQRARIVNNTVTGCSRHCITCAVDHAQVRSIRGRWRINRLRWCCRNQPIELRHIRHGTKCHIANQIAPRPSPVFPYECV